MDPQIFKKYLLHQRLLEDICGGFLVVMSEIHLNAIIVVTNGNKAILSHVTVILNYLFRAFLPAVLSHFPNMYGPCVL